MKSFSAYSDESGIFDHRFQSIAVVSGKEELLEELRNRLQQEIDNRQILEVKFSEITGYNSPIAEAARQFIKIAVKDFASNKKIRIDILSWDILDSRHAVPSRDDFANLGRMYYHLLIHTAKQWNQSHWNLYPDNNPKVDWKETAKYLNVTSLYRPDLQQPELVEVPKYEELQFGRIQQVDSIKEPLVQLADLFAGMARYSNEDGRQCVQWLSSQVSKWQLKFKYLCPRNNMKDKDTRKRVCLYQLIGKLYRLCGQYKLYVSINEKECLWTRICTKPINFWTYKPQGNYDKAPIK
ncbi:DUF3800 domain-containing protein [Chloroflexota bacterium]